jgi:hypothetical protein
MKVSRCDVKAADTTDFEDWPVLFDRPIAPGELSIDVEWKQESSVYLEPGPARLSLDDSAVDTPPQYRYEVELSPEDVGALLWNMPIDAVPTVIGGMLRRGKPEVIGAVVGQIIAYLVERGSGRAE